MIYNSSRSGPKGKGFEARGEVNIAEAEELGVLNVRGLRFAMDTFGCFVERMPAGSIASINFYPKVLKAYTAIMNPQHECIAQLASVGPDMDFAAFTRYPFVLSPNDLLNLHKRIVSSVGSASVEFSLTASYNLHQLIPQIGVDIQGVLPFVFLDRLKMLRETGKSCLQSTQILQS